MASAISIPVRLVCRIISSIRATRIQNQPLSPRKDRNFMIGFTMATRCSCTQDKKLYSHVIICHLICLPCCMVTEYHISLSFTKS